MLLLCSVILWFYDQNFLKVPLSTSMDLFSPHSGPRSEYQEVQLASYPNIGCLKCVFIWFLLIYIFCNCEKWFILYNEKSALWLKPCHFDFRMNHRLWRQHVVHSWHPQVTSKHNIQGWWVFHSVKIQRWWLNVCLLTSLFVGFFLKLHLIMDADYWVYTYPKIW